MKLYKILSAIIFLSLISCQTKTTENSVENPSENYDLQLSDAQIQQGKIAMDSIQKREIKDFIELTGIVEIPASHKADVTATLPGNLTSVNLVEGQKVHRGQTLLMVKSSEFIQLQQDFAALGAQLNFKKDDYLRQQKLFEEKVISEKKFLIAESEYKSNLAQYNGLKKKLQMLHINPDKVLQGEFFQSYPVVAPISGKINNIKIVSGSYINPYDVLLNIYDNSNVQLKIQSFEKNLEYIKQGQSIDFETPDGVMHQAKVKLISPSLDSETKSVNIYADILTEGNYYEGMFVTSRVITDIKEAWTLPIDALIQEGEEIYIYVLENIENNVYNFKKRAIKVNNKTDKYIILEDNKYPNLKIITQGAYMISE